MQFTKYSGLGNDFVFLDTPQAQSLKDPFTAAKILCDRHHGVGADGLVLLLPSAKAEVRMRIINSDGTEAEMCGNASRCVPLHLFRRGLISEKKVTLDTLAGLICTEIVDEEKGLVRVDMAEPHLKKGEIPVEGPAEELAGNLTLQAAGQTFTGTPVSMGNPHFVIFVEDIHMVPLETWGPALETHPAFPRKTNVEFVQILDDHTVRMRVWERGAGITQACGTGACATAVACVLNKKTAPQITVKLDGGDLQSEWAENKHVWMTGPAREVFTGNYLGDL